MELQTVSDVREFFRDALQSALDHQHLHVQAHTEHYIVNLLAMFSHTDALFEPDGERSQLKPLALLLAEAANAPDERQRFRTLQRMGDVALFVAGFLAGSFSRRPVDVDYHIAMGGRAYGTLAENCGPARARTLRQVFAELAAKFQPMVDALNEISESAYQHSDQDRLRLYELWVKTGSERSRQLLRKLGVEPAPAARSVLAH